MIDDGERYAQRQAEKEERLDRRARELIPELEPGFVSGSLRSLRGVELDQALVMFTIELVAKLLPRAAVKP